MQTSFLERHADNILGVYSGHKYHLTALGKLIVAASLKFPLSGSAKAEKEMTLIPLLRGHLLPA